MVILMLEPVSFLLFEEENPLLLQRGLDFGKPDQRPRHL